MLITFIQTNQKLSQNWHLTLLNIITVQYTDSIHLHFYYARLMICRGSLIPLHI